MRILHTCATYWPQVYGVAIAAQRISEGLAARGHQVSVAIGVAAPELRPNTRGCASNASTSPATKCSGSAVMVARARSSSPGSKATCS